MFVKGFPVYGFLMTVGVEFESKEEKSPERKAGVGTFGLIAIGWLSNTPSKAAKKKSLRRRIGPPSPPPKSLFVNGGLEVEK